MTMIIYQESDRSRSRPSSFASLVRPALLLIVKLRNDWHRRQTERMLEGLDLDIRKDIGWPSSQPDYNRR